MDAKTIEALRAHRSWLAQAKKAAKPRGRRPAPGYVALGGALAMFDAMLADMGLEAVGPVDEYRELSSLPHWQSGF